MPPDEASMSESTRAANETVLDKTLFASRWLFAPFYFGAHGGRQPWRG
jgi:hypothetical protein